MLPNDVLHTILCFCTSKTRSTAQLCSGGMRILAIEASKHLCRDKYQPWRYKVYSRLYDDSALTPEFLHMNMSMIFSDYHLLMKYQKEIVQVRHLDNIAMADRDVVQECYNRKILINSAVSTIRLLAYHDIDLMEDGTRDYHMHKEYVKLYESYKSILLRDYTTIDKNILNPLCTTNMIWFALCNCDMVTARYIVNKLSPNNLRNCSYSSNAHHDFINIICDHGSIDIVKYIMDNIYIHQRGNRYIQEMFIKIVTFGRVDLLPVVMECAEFSLNTHDISLYKKLSCKSGNIDMVKYIAGLTGSSLTYLDYIYDAVMYDNKELIKYLEPPTNINSVIPVILRAFTEHNSMVITYFISQGFTDIDSVIKLFAKTNKEFMSSYQTITFIENILALFETDNTPDPMAKFANDFILCKREPETDYGDIHDYMIAALMC